MLRLQSDERLVALVRRGHHGAFEALVVALPVAAARVLPAHARLAGGRGGRPPGGLRGLLQRDARRRPADQRAAVAVPDRPQPLAEPPAPRPGHRGRLDGRPPVGERRDDGRQGPPPRGLPPAHRRRAAARRDAAHRAAAARDRRALLRADRRGDGDHRPLGEVAPRPRPRLAGRGGRGAQAHLRGGPRRARRGRRGPAPHVAARAPPPPHAATAAPPSASSCARRTARSRSSSRSRRSCSSRRACSPSSG